MGNSCTSCCGDPELQFKHILYDIYPTREQFIIADTTAVSSTSSISMPSLSDLFHQKLGKNNNNQHHGANTSRDNTDDDDDSSRIANGDEAEDLKAHRQGPSNTSRFIDDDDDDGDDENDNNDESQQRNDSILLKSLHLGDDEDEEDDRKDALNNSTMSNKKKRKRQSRKAAKNRFGVDYNQFSLAELIQFVKRDPSKKMKLVLGKVVKVLEADCLSLTEHCPNVQMKNDSITSSNNKEEPRKLEDENGTNDTDEGIIVEQHSEQQQEEKENDKTTTTLRKKPVVSIFTPEENQERLKKLANQLSCMAEEKERQKQEESLAKFAYAELTADAQYHFDRILVGSLILREFLEHDEKEMKLRLEQERNQENNNNNDMIQSNRRRGGSSSNRLKPLISSATIDLYVPIILQACETLIYKRSEPPLKIAGTELFAVLCRRLSDATTNSNNMILMTPTLTTTKNLKNVSFMSTASAFSDRSGEDDDENDDNKDEPKNGSFSILSPHHHQQASRRLDSTQTFSTLLLPTSSVTGNYHEVGRKLIMTSQQATTLPQLLRMTYIGLGTTSIDALHQRYAALIAIAEVSQCLGTWLPDPSETVLTLSESLFKWFSGAPSPNLVVSSSSSSSSSRSNIGKNKARREHEALKKALRLACDRFCDDKNDNNNMEQDQQEEQNQRIEIGPLTLDSVIRDWCMLRVFLNAISAVSTSTTRQDVSEKIIDPLFDFLTENHLWWATGDKVLAIEKKRSEKKKLTMFVVDDKDRHAVESDFQFRGDESHQTNFNQQQEQHEARGEDGDHQHEAPSTFTTIPPFSWVLCRTLSSSLERQHQCGTLFLEKILERLVPMSSQRAKESKARIYERIGMINAVMEIIEVLPMIENEQQESSIQLRIVDTVKKCLYSSAQKKKVMMMQHQPSSAAAMAASFLLKDPSSARTTRGSKNGDDDDEEITAHLLERQQRVAVDCITSIATKTAIKRQWDVLSQIADSLLNELKSLILPTSSSSSSSYLSGEGKHMKELEEKRKREEEARRKRYENQYITRRYQQIQERDRQQQQENNSDIHSSSREFHVAQSPYSQIDISPYEFTTRQQFYHNHHSSSASSSTPRSRAQQHLLPISASYHHDSVSPTPTSLNYYTPRNQLVSKRASSATPNVAATPQSASHQNQIMAEMMAITPTPSITQNQQRQLPPLSSSNNQQHQQQRSSMVLAKSESPVITRTSLTLPLWTVLTRIAPLLRYLPSAQRRKLNFIQRVSSFLTEHGEPLALRCLSHHLNGGGRQERTKMMSLPSSSQLVLCGFTSTAAVRSNNSNDDENDIEEEDEEDELFSNRAVESLYRHIPLIPLAQFEQVTIFADGGNDQRQQNTETTTRAQEKFQRAVTAISATNAFSSSRSIVMKNNHNTPTLSTSRKSSSTSTTISSLEFLEKYLFGEHTLGKLEQDRQRRENSIQKLSSTATSARFSQYTVKKLREEEEEKSAINASPMFNSGISRNCGGALLTPIGIVSFVDFCKSYLNLRLKSKTTNKEVPVHFVSLILNFCEGFAKDEIEMQRREFKMMKQRMKELEMSPASRIKKTITTSKPPTTTPKKKKTRNILVKFAGLDDSDNDNDNKDNDEEKETQKDKEKEEKEKEEVEKIPEQTEPSTYHLSEFAMAWSLAGLALLFVLGSELQIPDLVDYSRELLKRRLQTDADYIKSSRQEQENNENKNQVLESAKKKLSSAVQKINVMSDLIASSAVLNPTANLEKSTNSNNRYGSSNQHQSPSSTTSSRIVPLCFQSKYSALFQVQRHHHTENEKNATNNNMMMRKKLAPHNSGFVVVSGHEFDILERKEKTVVVDSVEDLHLINKNTLKAYLSQRYGERSVEEKIV